MLRRMTLRSTIFGLASMALALPACGDDGGSTGDGGSPTTSTSVGQTDSSTGDAPGTTDGSSGGDSTSADSTGRDSTTTDGGSDSSDSGGSTAGSDSGSTGDTGSESTGTTGGEFDVPGCGTCPSGTICLANEAFQTEYECVPIPRECGGEIDCECGEQLCEDPFVACFDPPDEPNSLSCICIAC